MQKTTVLKPGEYPKLVNAIKTHDLEGFSNFYDACSSMFYGYIQKSLYQQKACEETLLQSFCVLWKSADEFDPLTQGLFVWSLKIVEKEVSKKKIDLLLNEIFACQKQPAYKIPI